MIQENEDHRFWHIRSANYDKLFWVKDKSYLDEIIEMGEFKKSHLVLDVGTGTGQVANTIKNHVQHVVAIDTSHSMLEKGKWEGVSVIKWDIGHSLFSKGLFDRVVARMVFHHILDNLDRAILRCYDLLRRNGKIIIAEGVPPIEDDDVIDWYTRMFKHKEKRRTFTSSQLSFYLEKNGFRNIKTHFHIMENFSVKNWLINSGLPQAKQKKIYKMHIDAEDHIKEAYQMRITDADCFIRTVNVILSGQR